MFRKATFAFAGVLGIVAAATLSTTAGAADTDAALVNNVTFYENRAFNTVDPLGAGAKGDVEADPTCRLVFLDGGGTQARSAELLVSSDRVKLFSDQACTTEVTELNSSNQRDAGLTWLATVRSYKQVF